MDTSSLHLNRRPLVDDVLLEEVVLRLVILVDLPFHVLCDELHKQLVDSMLCLDLHRHRDEEGYEEEDAACKRNNLLCRQITLFVAWELLYLAIVRQEAHDRRDSTRDHHDEIEEEYGVQDFILPRDMWKAPVVHLQA